MPPFTWVWTVSMQWLTESYRWVWKVQLLSTSATSGCKLYKVIPRVGEWHAISEVVLSSANHLGINLSNLIQSQLNIDIFLCVNRKWSVWKAERRWQNPSQRWLSTERKLNTASIEGSVMRVPWFPSGAAWTTFFILPSSNFLQKGHLEEGRVRF